METLYFRGRYYQGSLSDDTCEKILDLIENYTVVPALKHCIYNLSQDSVNTIKRAYELYESTHESLEGFDWKFPLEKRQGELRDDQTVAVAFFFLSGAAINGKEVGLGKTVEMAATFNLLKCKYPDRPVRCLFLTQKGVVGQIRDKLIQFTGEYFCMLESAEKHVVSSFCNRNKNALGYSVVGAHSLLNSAEFMSFCKNNTFDMVVVDESTVLNNMTTNLYKNAKIFLQRVKWKFLLNATPIENKARDVYNQLCLLDKGYMPTVSEFSKTFCKFKMGGYGRFVPDGYKNADKFKRAISLRYITDSRRNQGARYEDNFCELWLIDLSKEQSALMRRTVLYQMVSDYPSGVDESIVFSEKTTPKFACLLHLVKQILSKNETVIVYCRFKKCQASIKKRLQELNHTVAVVNGETKPKARDEIVEAFNSGGYDVLVTNTVRGLDTKNCDHCILYTIDPNPQQMVQFTGRITRMFDVIGKRVYLLISQGKEKKQLETRIKMKVDASDKLLSASNDLLSDVLLNKANKDDYAIRVWKGDGTA